MYAAGKIPGGFIKREARPSENAILAARQTDRPIRPLFPEGYKDDVQIVITVLSTDQENNPDVVGTIAASAALWLLFPFLLAVAALVKLTSPGTVFFRQLRVGLHGKKFHMLKFRSMVSNAEALKATL